MKKTGLFDVNPSKLSMRRNILLGSFSVRPCGISAVPFILRFLPERASANRHTPPILTEWILPVSLFCIKKSDSGDMKISPLSDLIIYHPASVNPATPKSAETAIHIIRSSARRARNAAKFLHVSRNNILIRPPASGKAYIR